MDEDKNLEEGNSGDEGSVEDEMPEEDLYDDVDTL